MKLRETALAAAALALVGTSANARPHDRDHRAAENSHRDGRPPTLPDGGRLAAQTRRSAYLRLADARPALRVPGGMHEAIEAYLCKQAGISQVAVDRFDQAYERRRKPGDDSEPGDDPKPPYHKEHMFASKVERMLANKLGVNWSAYDREVSSK